LFNGVTESPYAGQVPGPESGRYQAGCESITPNTLTGGKTMLGPETAKQANTGVVFKPSTRFSANLDLWEVRKENAIDTFTLATLLANYELFKGNFIRAAAGALVQIDQRWVNAGTRITRGIDAGARTNGKAWDGVWSAGIDGAYLLEKKSRATGNTPFGASEVGRFTFTGDLGLKWKHTATVAFKKGDWSTALYNAYRAGYKDQVLPGVANGLVTPANYQQKVDPYSILHASISYRYSGIRHLTLSAGVKNIFDQDPPFAITYDSNTGAGSAWKPRVAGPRGRSINLFASYKFL